MGHWRDDPFELNNQIDNPELKAVADQLSRELSEWMKQIGDRPFANAQ
jgi:hypothetical protein